MFAAIINSKYVKNNDNTKICKNTDLNKIKAGILFNKHHEWSEALQGSCGAACLQYKATLCHKHTALAATIDTSHKYSCPVIYNQD